MFAIVFATGPAAHLSAYADHEENYDHIRLQLSSATGRQRIPTMLGECRGERRRGRLTWKIARIRGALERHWAASDANDFAVEHEIYREDAVLHYPQSGERIRGRDKIQECRTVQPSKKRFPSMGVVK